MLAFVTGPVRSGKSAHGLALAIASGRRVVMAVGASPDDEEMARRIDRHQAERPETIEVLETCGDPEWLGRVPRDACLLVDCLGTIIGSTVAALVDDDLDTAGPEAEREAGRLADVLVDRLLERDAPTVVVSNEVGWGIVPASPLGRLFRDVVGRANRRLADGADAAWLVVNGRCIDLRGLPMEVSWPE